MTMSDHTHRAFDVDLQAFKEMLAGLASAAGPQPWPLAAAGEAVRVAEASSTAAISASGSGNPEPISETVVMPPIITNSPWAKLMTWLALKMIEKPSATSA